MRVACDANVRTTQAADKDGLPVALRVAFTGGAGKLHFEKCIRRYLHNPISSEFF